MLMPARFQAVTGLTKDLSAEQEALLRATCLKQGLFLPAKPFRETLLSLDNELGETALLPVTLLREQAAFFLSTYFFICPKS